MIVRDFNGSLLRSHLAKSGIKEHIDRVLTEKRKECEYAELWLGLRQQVLVTYRKLFLEYDNCKDFFEGITQVTSSSELLLASLQTGP